MWILLPIFQALCIFALSGAALVIPETPWNPTAGMADWIVLGSGAFLAVGVFLYGVHEHREDQRQLQRLLRPYH